MSGRLQGKQRNYLRASRKAEVVVIADSRAELYCGLWGAPGPSRPIPPIHIISGILLLGYTDRLAKIQVRAKI